MDRYRLAAAAALLVGVAFLVHGATQPPGGPERAAAEGPSLLPVEDAPARPSQLPEAAKTPATLPPDVGNERAVLPGARAESSSVTLDWLGPVLVQAGQPTSYTLTVRNTYPVPVHKVAIHVRPAAGMTVTPNKGDAIADGDVFVWQLGTLLPSQEKSVTVKLTVRSKGEVSPRAWVTFTGSSAVTLRLKAHEPKLALKSVPPQGKITVGDTASFVLTVTNAGDGPAHQVKLRGVLSDGLEYARGREADFELGNLGAGESRTVQLVCTAKAGGAQRCEVQALAQGDVKARDECTIQVLTPVLELQVAGPAVRYRDRKATYTFRVLARGDVPAGNVTVVETVPAGFKYVSAGDGGLYDPARQTVTWFLGEMTPGQVRDVQVEVVAVQGGEQRHKVLAYSERGLNKVEVRREILTRVEELASLQLETAAADDPIELGKETTYEALVTNTGATTETQVRVVCTLPDKMELTGVTAPVRYHVEGNVVVFDPLSRLAPRGDACYQFKVRAKEAGDVRFRAQVTTASLIEPIIKTQATRIYADNPAQVPVGMKR